MIKQFIRELSQTMETIQTRLQRDQTFRTRVERRFSVSEIAALFGKEKTYLTKQIARYIDIDPSFPEGRREGRERTFNLDEVMLMRTILHCNSRKKDYLHWRKPGDPLKIVTFGAQKGGTGKSLAATHYAQYLNLQYGLRVGVIDMDPQATATLYFADSRFDLFDADTRTVAHFSGLDDPPAARVLATKGEIPPLPSPEDQNNMWIGTPWPGIRLIPGNSEIQNGDISLYFMAPIRNKAVYSTLKDAINTWEAANPPKTPAEDMLAEDGTLDIRVYQEALDETLDVIIIDQQPSLTLMQLNGLMAATNIVIPQTMKGFDLSTLTSYSRSIYEYVEHLSVIVDEDEMEEYCPGPHAVLPSIVQEQNNRDLAQMVELHSQSPDLFLPVWYQRSDAIANAAEEYKSVYEYDPPKSRRASAKAFLRNANAVNDALVNLVWQGGLPSRGYADEFVQERWT